MLPWKEYFAIAQYLQGQTNDQFSQEAALRCAISRVYFAAFCHARNYARDYQKYVPTNQYGEHRSVKEHYQKRGDIAIASDLDLRGCLKSLC
jgi:hypothetical protein